MTLWQTDPSGAGGGGRLRATRNRRGRRHRCGGGGRACPHIFRLDSERVAGFGRGSNRSYSKKPGTMGPVGHLPHKQP